MLHCFGGGVEGRVSKRPSSEVLPEGNAPLGAGTGQFRLSRFVSFRKEEPDRALPSRDRDRTDRNSRKKKEFEEFKELQEFKERPGRTDDWRGAALTCTPKTLTAICPIMCCSRET